RTIHPLQQDFFVFSSRRRHTRSKRDWSSDVCSSDLSGLIIALSILGFSIHIIIHPVQRKQSSALINKFHPWFQILLLPLLVLLFIACFRRISDYGFTEPRYFLLLLDVWILGMTLYLLLAEKKRMHVLPISVFLM